MHETNRLFIPIIWWINKLKGCIESFVSTFFLFFVTLQEMTLTFLH